MLVINKGFGVGDKVWTFTFGEPYQIVPLGTNKKGEDNLERRLNLLKKYDEAVTIGHVGVIMPHRYSNIKEIKQERVLVKEFINRKGKLDEEVLYDKEFDVYVIYFNNAKPFGFVGLD